MTRTYDSQFIGGEWIPSQTTARIDVISASTEDLFGMVPSGDLADADAAVRAARRAFAEWALQPPPIRAGVLRRIQEGLEARAEEIADCITGEVGTPAKISRRVQTASPITVFGFYADLLEQYEFSTEVNGSLIVEDPVGVVVCITPWNYPLHQIALKVAPALAAGCTVVIKPSSLAPLNAFLFAEVCEQAGVPAGVVNVVSGPSDVVGETLVRHPETDMVSLTGSTRAGRRVAALAAERITRVTLELGGKSASVILDDAELPAAVKGTINSCFLNSGQTCSALTRMLVPQDSYAQAASLAHDIGSTFTVGDPFAGQAKLGPLISAEQREAVRDYIRIGLQEGAELILGGPEIPEGLHRGFYVQPTIFGRVDPRSKIAQDEIFGPVLSIITYRDEDEAVEIANGTTFGLSGGVWSSDQARALGVARRLRTGQVDLNGAPFNYWAPFGGFKQSGYGRELGIHGMTEFLESKAIQLSEADVR
jgi:acyl-CoA reductase-like NAD-dependent aldehyde dehydrogenase